MFGKIRQTFFFALYLNNVCISISKHMETLIKKIDEWQQYAQSQHFVAGMVAGSIIILVLLMVAHRRKDGSDNEPEGGLGI